VIFLDYAELGLVSVDLPGKKVLAETSSPRPAGRPNASDVYQPPQLR
jgi:hypothetical protein